MSNVVVLRGKPVKSMKNLVVKGKTTKPITFFAWEEQVNVPVGTDIAVDLDKMIAKIGEHHTAILLDEFEVVHAN